MRKITKYYLNKASYIAIDEHGKRIDIAIDYWNGTFTMSKRSQQLEAYAAKLVNKKHKVNFIYKLRGGE